MKYSTSSIVNNIHYVLLFLELVILNVVVGYVHEWEWLTILFFSKQNMPRYLK